MRNKIDGALYFKWCKDELIDLIGQYIDNSFQAGSEEFLKITSILLFTNFPKLIFGKFVS